MKSKLLSYTISATVIDEDDEGNVVAKEMTRPIEIIGKDALLRFTEDVDRSITIRTAEFGDETKDTTAK